MNVFVVFISTASVDGVFTSYDNACRFITLQEYPTAEQVDMYTWHLEAQNLDIFIEEFEVQG